MTRVLAGGVAKSLCHSHWQESLIFFSRILDSASGELVLFCQTAAGSKDSINAMILHWHVLPRVSNFYLGCVRVSCLNFHFARNLESTDLCPDLGLVLFAQFGIADQVLTSS